MVKKTVKTFTYTGLGFPIVLHNVEIVCINGEDVPKIDIKYVAAREIKKLILQKTKLTGNQIKFIRTYFSLSLREFSNIVNESHTAIRKWESFKNQSTNMDPNIEKTIRLYICDEMFKDKSTFYEKYHAVNEIISENARLSRVKLSV